MGGHGRSQKFKTVSLLSKVLTAEPRMSDRLAALPPTIACHLVGLAPRGA
jgi:hypothetical protein